MFSVEVYDLLLLQTLCVTSGIHEYVRTHCGVGQVDGWAHVMQARAGLVEF